MKKIGVILIIFSIIITNCLPFSVSATTKRGTKTLNEGEFLSWKISLSDCRKLSYQIRALGGPLIDVFLFNETNYNNYRTNRDFEYDFNGSELRTTRVYKQVILNPGTYYLVVDYTNLGSAWKGHKWAVSIKYNIHYYSPPEDSSEEVLLWIYVIGMIIIIMIVLDIIGIIRLKRSRD